MEKESIQLHPVGNNKYASNDNKPQYEENDDDSYDPHLHRNAPNGTSNFETLVHLLKGSLGTGILAMPEAFKNSGLINGAICTVLIGILCTYGLHILVKAQYILCKKLKVPILTYPESMKIALETGPPCLRPFANASPIIVDVFLVIYQLGICCVYILFVTVNVKAVFDGYFETKLSLPIHMTILLIPFILILLIPNLKILAPFSILANIITFICFGIVLYYVFQNMQDINELPYVGSLYTFPLFFGTTLFALEAVGVVVAVENNMKTPKSFGGTYGVLNISMVIVVLFYVGMGFFGYWSYGDQVQASITLNFPQTILANSAKILYSIAIYISYGLQGYVPIEILWNTYILKRLDNHNLRIWEYLLRVATVLITFVLAISIPLLGLFISLFGAFCLSALGIAFPAIMDICVKWPNHGKGYIFVLIKNYFLILIGILGLLAGSYSCLSEIIKELTA